MELNRSIRKTMAELQREGTTGMSVENLRMIVRTPSTGLQGAPLGTNAQYYYAEMFARLVRAMKITGFSILK